MFVGCAIGYSPAPSRDLPHRHLDLICELENGERAYSWGVNLYSEFLLKAADEAPHGITIYGQEMDVATWALAKMNMILHGHPTADLWRGNTLSAPHFTTSSGLKTFDFVVANPPFSTKSWSNGIDPNNDEYRRFEYGIPPAKNGDYAFLLHAITSLKSTGRAAIILPHGVLFRGNTEARIRRNLIKRGLIEGVIGLPPNLFFGTGIPASIIVIDKAGSRDRESIFMLDASRGFRKDGNKNRLRERDIHKIVDVFNDKADVPRFSRKVPVTEIEDTRNDYNLNIPRYINSSDPEDLHDLEAHLRGGIPERDIDELQSYWSVMPALRAELFKSGDRAHYYTAKVGPEDIKDVISSHSEFVAFRDEAEKALDGWIEKHRVTLLRLDVRSRPKTLIKELSEDLLGRFEKLALHDGYAVYQRLMDYWSNEMQDDVFLIASEGWAEAAKPRAAIDDKERKIKEAPDLVVARKKYKMDLVPPHLLERAFYESESTELERLREVLDAATSEFADFTEEHGGDEGLLSEVASDKGKVTKTAARARLRELGSKDDDEEHAVVEKALSLIEAEATAKAAEKKAVAELDATVHARYADLTEEEIRQIVVMDKWMTSIRETVLSEIMGIRTSITKRIKTIEERYGTPLPRLEEALTASRIRVEGHLKQMGLEWE